MWGGSCWGDSGDECGSEASSCDNALIDSFLRRTSLSAPVHANNNQVTLGP